MRNSASKQTDISARECTHARAHIHLSEVYAQRRIEERELLTRFPDNTYHLARFLCREYATYTLILSRER